jgi:ribosomal protein S18 acetylase RimI-like enzyme
LDNLIIKQVTLNESKYIALLARITFNETFGHLFRNRDDLLNYFEQTFSVQKIKSSILKPNNFYWIAYFNDLPVGYAKLKLNSTNKFIDAPNQSQLQKIYVLKDFISKKIGFKLQEKLLLKAKNSKSKIIWLSVLKENTRALNFYKKNNFNIKGEHNFKIGIEKFNFYVMSKKL